jgi:parallel beta-helix repeat protein
LRTGNSSVTSSRALGNASTGIQLEGDSNSVISSTASGNGWNGIYVEGSFASVKSTTASGNSNNGIEVDGEGATFAGNHAEGNGMPNATSDGNGLGIVVESFTTAPVGKNVARGNDDATECQPSSLCSVNSKAKAGVPISSCGQAVTTNAVLTKDLTCFVDGIVVGASGITIDLQGHTLTGDHVHEGVHNKDGYHDVTLKNGVIPGSTKASPPTTARTT